MIALAIPDPHPATDGHFPGAPVLPAVVLLDEVLHGLAARGERGPWRITAAKFLKPVLPGERLTLRLEPQAGGAFRFTLARDGTPVATGQLAGA